MMRFLFGSLLCLGLIACTVGILPPATFTVNGVTYALPAESNVPTATDAASNIVVIEYRVTWDEMTAISCNAAVKAGCSLKIGDTMCVVWLLKEGILPKDVDARVRRHERGGHCNGHNHVLEQRETGAVIVWD